MYGTSSHTLIEATRKAEHYCVYQERCHQEVIAKLRTLRMIPEAVDLIIVHLIEHDFLNESRFACSFARGKHRIKHWGKIRIVRELKMRSISEYNIKQGLKEINAEYFDNFEILAQRHWEQMTERIKLPKRKKFCDFLLRKGFESGMVYEKVKELENTDALLKKKE
jgi:regulatory protein